MIEQLMLASPLIIILIGVFLLLFMKNDNTFTTDKLNLIAVFFLAIASILQYVNYDSYTTIYLMQDIFGDTYVIDDFARIFDFMFTAGAILTLLINHDYFKSRNYFSGEYFALILLSIFGMILLIHANELLTMFIALEIASLSIYALIGYQQNNRINSEAMMKYIILGSMTGAFFILGTALIYGAVGSTFLNDIAYYVTMNDIDEMGMFMVGGTFLSITIFFKIGAVPFHSWVVDLYHGAPYPITMLMASTFKIAIFAIALRLYLFAFEVAANFWSELLLVLTVMTLIGGSLLAIRQTLVKRMLASSSIVHSGYLLIAISSVGLDSKVAAPAVMFYLIAYFISAVGSFGILSFLASQGNQQMRYEDFKGLANERPYIALMMSIFMLSLAGFPSTIGFLGKFYIFSSAIESGQIFLTGLGILTAFISVYYYFKLIAYMYFYESLVTQKKFPFHLSTVFIAFMAIIAVWGGIGSSLIPFVPGADTFIEIAIKAIDSFS